MIFFLINKFYMIRNVLFLVYFLIFCITSVVISNTYIRNNYYADGICPINNKEKYSYIIVLIVIATFQQIYLNNLVFPWKYISSDRFLIQSISYFHYFRCFSKDKEITIFQQMYIQTYFLQYSILT